MDKDQNVLIPNNITSFIANPTVLNTQNRSSLIFIIFILILIILALKSK